MSVLSTGASQTTTASATVTAAHSSTASHAEIRRPARQTSSTPSGSNATAAATQTLPSGSSTCTNTCGSTRHPSPRRGVDQVDRPSPGRGTPDPAMCPCLLQHPTSPTPISSVSGPSSATSGSSRIRAARSPSDAMTYGSRGRFGEDGAMSTAAQHALARVSEVRDDPDARLALMCRLYAGSRGDGTRHLPYRRAAVAFMTWQLRRGLLRPPHDPRSGSPWWRAVNERLLRDGWKRSHCSTATTRPTPPRAGSAPWTRPVDPGGTHGT